MSANVLPNDAAGRLAVAVCRPQTRPAITALAVREGLEIAAWFEPLELASADSDRTAAFESAVWRPDVGTVLVEDFHTLSDDPDAVFTLWRSMKAAGKVFHRLGCGEISAKALAKTVILDRFGLEGAAASNPRSIGLMPATLSLGMVRGVDGAPELHPDIAWSIAAFFMQTAGGVGLKESVADMADIDREVRGKVFAWRDLGSVLHNPAYLGLQRWRWPSRGKFARDPADPSVTKTHLTDAPWLAVIDGELWLEARWASADRAFGPSTPTQPRPDLLRGLGRCSCGAGLHVVRSNGRRSFRCSATLSRLRTCALRGSLPMEWCERALFAAVREWRGRTREALSPDDLAALDAHAGGLLRKLEAHDGVFPLELAEHADLARDLRSCLRGFVREVGDGGVITLRFSVDLAALVPPAAAAAVPVAADTLVAILDPATLKVEERKARQLEDDRIMQRAAAQGSYDVPESAWTIVEPSFAFVNLKFPGGELSARTLLDGLLCLIGTGGVWKRLPGRYGDAGEFKKAWQRIVRAGVWDDVAHILDRHFPGLVDDRHKSRLATSEFPRRQDFGPRTPRQFGPVETARYVAALDRLAAEFPDRPIVQRNASILRDALGGDDRRELAVRHGVSVGVVNSLLSRLRRARSIAFLRPATEAKPDRGRLCKLDDDQIRKLKIKVSSGLHPQDTGRVLTMEALIEWLADSSGVRYHPQGLRSLLRREGVWMPATIGARRLPPSAPPAA